MTHPIPSRFAAVARSAATAVAAIAAAACFFAGGAFAGINVTLDVNSGKPPKVLMVAFDKDAKDAKDFKASDKKGNAQFSFAEDGALQIKISRLGSDIVLPFPKEIDIAKANYVLLTFKVEGQHRSQWQGNWGQWQVYKGTKLWWSAAVADVDGRRCPGWANLDSVSPDGFMPAETKIVTIPAMFFTRTAEGSGDPARAAAFMLIINEQRDTVERDYTITIDRLVVAE